MKNERNAASGYYRQTLFNGLVGVPEHGKPIYPINLSPLRNLIAKTFVSIKIHK